MKEFWEAYWGDMSATLLGSSTTLALSLTAASVIAVAGASFAKLRSPGLRFFEILGAVGVLTFIAFLAGHYATNSRSSAVGDFGPVLLGGFGALFALSYIQERVAVVFAGVASVAFVTSFFLGTVLGGYHRHLNETVRALEAKKESDRVTAVFADKAVEAIAKLVMVPNQSMGPFPGLSFEPSPEAAIDEPTNQEELARDKFRSTGGK